ncbi:MAG: hypothetical protein FWF77_05990, partial [Defluviitaleaceae bacterium]|nr:hypothetical protein [Defluviitaleaceae bacterium]
MKFSKTHYSANRLRGQEKFISRIGHHGRSERSERFPRHRGHVLAAAHSFEAGSKPGASREQFPGPKKTSRRVTL